MESLKMSDVFKLPMVCEDGDGFIYSNDLRHSIQFDDSDTYMMSHKKAVAHAINNHDRLVEENAQQRESLDAFRELVKAQTQTMNELNERCKEIEKEKARLRFALHKARQGYKNLIELRALPNTGWNGEAQDLIDLCDDALE